ncbi:MAG: MCE family protein [Deltaproteobacteria bacterium]|nr:MCE family protein [Deltaproteobacteria bacterium]
MQRKKGMSWSELRVGIFTLAGFALLVFGVLLIGKRSGFLVLHYPLHTYFTSAGGLVDGAPVWLAGIEVGEVTRIRFEEDLVRIDMKIQRKVQEKIRENSQAKITSKGLLGDKIIEISLGSLPAAPLKNGSEIPATPTKTDLTDLMTSATSIVTGLESAVGSIRQVAAKLNSSTGTLGRLVHDDQLYQNLQEATGRLNTFLGSIEGEKISEISIQLHTILEKIDRGEGTMGSVINDKELYEKLIQTTDELKALIQDIKENPKRYLKVEIF